ncbi:MAG TPA: hypothetical protein VGO62_14575, partial [Myxococcota bacterium]
ALTPSIQGFDAVALFDSLLPVVNPLMDADTRLAPDGGGDGADSHENIATFQAVTRQFLVDRPSVLP